MGRGYSLELTAHGEAGEELSTTSTLEAESKADAKDLFRERIQYVEYWDITITRVVQRET